MSVQYTLLLQLPLVKVVFCRRADIPFKAAFCCLPRVSESDARNRFCLSSCHCCHCHCVCNAGVAAAFVAAVAVSVLRGPKQSSPLYSESGFASLCLNTHTDVAGVFVVVFGGD